MMCVVEENGREIGILTVFAVPRTGETLRLSLGEGDDCVYRVTDVAHSAKVGQHMVIVEVEEITP